jgi:hypothetical protein
MKVDWCGGNEFKKTFGDLVPGDVFTFCCDGRGTALLIALPDGVFLNCSYKAINCSYKAIMGEGRDHEVVIHYPNATLLPHGVK